MAKRSKTKRITPAIRAEVETLMVLLVPGDQVLKWLDDEHGIKGKRALELVKSIAAELPDANDERDQRLKASAHRLYSEAVAAGNISAASRALDQIRSFDQADKKAKPRGRKFDDEQEQTICRRFLEGASDEDLAAAYGVHKNTIANIRKRRGVDASQRAPGVARGTGEPSIDGGLISKRAELGAPPDDPIEAMSWARRALLHLAHEVWLDPDYPGGRRAQMKEFERLVRAASQTKDEDALADALRQLREDREGIDDPGPELKDGSQRKHRRPRIAKPG